MRFSPIFGFTVVASMATLGCAPASFGPKVRVISIGDGDTIRVQQGHQRMTIRLGCIDAPEMAQAPYGAIARTNLRSRLRLGSTVTLKPQTVDRYGRTVAEVVGGVNINLALVEEGQAFVYRKYLGQCDVKAYLDAEERASRRRYGVWQAPGGITRPWDFRLGKSPAPYVRNSGSVPGGRRYRCSEIGSYGRAKELLRQGHRYLDSNGDGEACESLRR